jgi:hypothetical protein
VTGNNDKELLGQLLENMNRKNLAEKLMMIYLLKVKEHKDYLYLDRYCHLVRDTDRTKDSKKKMPECTDWDCKEKKLTVYDKKLVNSGFKIFLIIKQLEDKMPNDQRLISLGMQKVVHKPEFELFKKEYNFMSHPDFNTGSGGSAINNNLNLLLQSRKKKASSKVSPNMTVKSTRYFEKDEEFPLREGAEEPMAANNSLTKLFKGMDLSGVPEVKGSAMNTAKTHSPFLDGGIRNGKVATKIDQLSNAEEVLAEYYENEKRKYYNEARTFFNSYVASVEILFNQKIEKVHFKIPYCCKFISRSVKESIIRKVNRGSDQERLESFFFKVSNYEYKMMHSQALSQWKYLYFLTKNWETIKIVNLLVVVGINVIMLIDFTHVATENFDIAIKQDYNSLRPDVSFTTQSRRVAFYSLSIAQLVLSFFVLLLCLYERYPIILYKFANQDTYIKLREKKKNEKFNDESTVDWSAMAQSDGLEDRKVQPGKRQIFFSIITDMKNLNTIIIFGLSILAMFGYYIVYAVLLFDIVFISKSLSTIIKSLSKSGFMLFLTFALAVIILYLYSIMGFNYFPQDYTHFVTSTSNQADEIYKNYCHTLWDCFISTMNNGLRAHGGIGEAIRSQPRGTFGISRGGALLATIRVRLHLLHRHHDPHTQHHLRHHHRRVRQPTRGEQEARRRH